MAGINTMIDTLKYLEFGWARRKTKYGLAVIAMVVISFLSWFFEKFSIGNLFQILVFVFVGLSLLVWWLYASGRWIRKSKKILVVHALRASGADSQRVISSTMELLGTKLDRLRLRHHFKFVELGSDAISTVDDAQSFTNKHKVNLLIHGTVTSGNIDSKYYFDLKNFFFTFHLEGVPTEEARQRLLKADLGLFTGNRDWMIDQTNDLKHIERVADNLVEIVLSTIAIGLSLNVAHIKTSISLMESVLPLLERKVSVSKKPIKLDERHGHLYVPIEVIRSGRLRTLLCGIHIAHSRYLINQGQYSDAIVAAEKGLDHGVDQIGAYAAIAISHFFNGNTGISEEFVEKIGKIDRKNPIYLVDKAFFCIQKSDYSTALRLYNTLVKYGIEREAMIPFEVISFLSEQASSKKSEYAFDFAIGFMHHHFGDPVQGGKYFDRFLASTVEAPQYRVLVDEARRLTHKNGKDKL